jgi:type I restriction enzyme M protein
MAGFVLANGSMSANQSGEGEIRRAIIEADLVDCMVALPGQLFYSTPIAVCLWFISRDKTNNRFRDRRRQTLFIDARKLGHLVDRVHRELSEQETQRIAQTYHAWRGSDDSLRNPHSAVREYADVLGFCKSATIEDIARRDYLLTTGPYVGSEAIEDDGEPFEEKMTRLVSELSGQFNESAALENAIRSHLTSLGYTPR